MQRRWFTLIELLVVIAIIAILAGMLLPVLGKVKSTAYTVQCANDCKTFGTAVTIYQGDNNDFYPMTIGSSAEVCYSIWTSNHPDNPVAFVAPYLHHDPATEVGRVRRGYSAGSERGSSPLASPAFDESRRQSDATGTSRATYASNSYWGKVLSFSLCASKI